MNRKIKVFAAFTGASVLGLSTLTPSAVAEADVSASVGVANMYYWRGMDLGNGDAAVSGDLSISTGGAYAGVWGSSGDVAMGTEYDLYLGYGGEVSGFTYDLNYTTYVYPSADEAVDAFDMGEVIVSGGYGPIAVTYYHGVQDLEDYWYGTIAAEFDAFSVTYGVHESDFAHVDFGYAYNENLSFILGFNVDDADTGNDEPNFVVSYSMPID